MSRSSLISIDFASLWFPPILLLKPLQFSPLIQNIPCCFVFGAVLWIYNNPASTASMTLLFLLLFAFAAFLSMSSSMVPSFAFISLIILSMSSSRSLPCFLNRSALILSCLIVLWLVVFNVPFIHKELILVHVSNNFCCLLSASFRR